MIELTLLHICPISSNWRSPNSEDHKLVIAIK